MPEMPEVETIARRLRRTVIGKCIVGIRLSGSPLRKPIPSDFADQLKGRVLHRIHRRGKYLVFQMKPPAFWVIHFGMSGKILYVNRESRSAEHTHAVIRFSDNSELHYRDSRRFGLLKTYEVSRLSQIPELAALGKDPLSSTFTVGWLWPQLRLSVREIKSFLLDQHKIAGIGNIYACETLFHARIHPERRCQAISWNTADRLVRSIRDVLRGAILHRGSSISDFTDSDGTPGIHQNFLHVYQREDERCYRCRERIRRIVQSNRSSFFCPRCQPFS